MVSTLKMAMIGAGAAGAAGVVAVTQPFFTEEGAAPSEVCLKADIGFFEGASARCYTQEEIMRLADAPLLDSAGERAVVSLSHPTDASAPPADYATCRSYQKARFEGWYALTSADMRREGYFIRACGVLSVLNEAQKAEHGFFEKGSPSLDDILTLAGTMTFGEAALTPQDARVEKEQGYVWRVSGAAMSAEIHEIANADFDNDGVEEILAFIAGAPQGGTASFYEVGLLEKDAAGAALEFTPFRFTGEDAAGAAG